MPGLLQRLLTRSGILPGPPEPVARRPGVGGRQARETAREATGVAEGATRSRRGPGGQVQSLEPLARLGRAHQQTSIARSDMLRATMMLDIADRRRGRAIGQACSTPIHVVAHVERAIASRTNRIGSFGPHRSQRPDAGRHVPGDSRRHSAADFFSQRDNTKQNLKLSMLDVAPAWTSRRSAS